MGFVCVDVDGTLLNLNEALRVKLKEIGLDYKYENITHYDFRGDIGVNPKEHIYPLFNDLYIFSLELLYPFEGALEALDDLTTLTEVRMYTGLKTSNQNIVLLRDAFGHNHNMTGNSFVGNKPVMLGADALFEDCFETCEEWISAGYEGYIFLIDQPYNQQINNNPSSSVWSKIIRCEDFADAVKKYTQIYTEKGYFG